MKKLILCGLLALGFIGCADADDGAPIKVSLDWTDKEYEDKYKKCLSNRKADMPDKFKKEICDKQVKKENNLFVVVTPQVAQVRFIPDHPKLLCDGKKISIKGLRGYPDTTLTGFLDTTVEYGETVALLYRPEYDESCENAKEIKFIFTDNNKKEWTFNLK